MTGLKWQVILVSILASAAFGRFEYTSPLDDLSSDFLITEGVITGMVSATDGTASWSNSSLSGFASISGTTLTDGIFTVSGGIISAGTWQGSTITVPYGGTGATTLTDGGLLVGSGTSAITALGVASNGQIPIGDGSTDPVLATITGTANRVTVSNAAGSITLTAPQDLHTGAEVEFAKVTVDNLTLDGNTLQAINNNNLLLDSVDQDVRITAGDDTEITATDDLTITATGDDVIITAGGEIRLRPGNDITDYLNISTTGDQTTVNFAGQNGLITADSGMISFNDENLSTSGTLGCGAITVADGSGISLQEAITFTGANLENRIQVPDNLVAAFVIFEGTTPYLTFKTSDGAEEIILSKKLTAGATEIEGSAFDINGGTVDAITSLTVANSVDIGNYTLTANGLTIDGTFTDGTMSISGGNLSSVGTIGCGTITSTGVATTTGLIVGDVEYIEVGVGSLTGALGSDGRIYSDGTDTILQIESPTGINANYTNPSLTFSYYDFFPALHLYLPVIRSPRSDGFMVLDRYMYVRDTTGTNDGFVYIPDYNDDTIALTLSFNSTSDYGNITTVGTTKDIRIQPSGNLLLNPGGTGVRIGSVVAPGEVLSVTGDATIGDGGTTNYSQFEADGTLEFNGTATVFDDIRTPLTAIRITGPGGTTPPDEVLYKGSVVLAFGGAGTDDEKAFFVIQIPHWYKEGSDIVPHIHWTPEDNTAGNVRWVLTYSWANIDAAFPAETFDPIEIAADETTDKHQRDDFTAISGTGKTISSMLLCSIQREDSDANDTFNNKDAYLLEIDFHAEKDTVGSRLIGDSK